MTDCLYILKLLPLFILYLYSMKHKALSFDFFFFFTFYLLLYLTFPVTFKIESNWSIELNMSSMKNNNDNNGEED